MLLPSEKKALLVVTTVHPPDDPRIREKYLRTLAADFDITYVSRAPGPSDETGLETIVLRGGRLRRWLIALRTVLGNRADVLVLHDPELLPIGWLARAINRVPVVFDLHENLPAQLATRSATPPLLRWPSAALARSLLRFSNRFLIITLAEDGYQALVSRERPVFANYPDILLLPEPVSDRTGVIYVGDVTETRGARTLVDAVGLMEVPQTLTFVGRCRPDLRSQLEAAAAATNVDLTVTGWMPYSEALALAARSAVGVAPLHDLPNYRHSLPTKVLEYLAVGIPVVTSDLPGTRIVLDGLPGVEVVPPGASAALAEGITRVVHARWEGDELRAAVLSRYRWDGDAVRDFYSSLA